MPVLKDRKLQSELTYWKRATWKGLIPVHKVAKLENDYKFRGRIKSFRIRFIAESLF